MDNSIWNALCKQPTLKASSQKYAQLVYESTTQLHQSIQSILSALDRRAIGFTKCANFESALHDAKAMQKLSPSSPLGYIREASIYSEQGKQLQAIRVCDKGMTKVDVMDTHYDELQRAKMDAEQRQNTRIDFISQLPVDIVMTTLIPMITNGCLSNSSKSIPCLYVSNVWRDSIIKCFGGLHFDIGDDTYADLPKLAPFIHHIKETEVHGYSNDPWLADLLRDNDFCSLKTLFINGCAGYCIDGLVPSFKSIGNTLTTLQIGHDDDITLPIGDVLINCPNLESLAITQPSATNIRSLPKKTWPKLTSLIIESIENDVISCREVMAIGKRFPSLKKLQFSPCEDVASIRVVLDHYPWISNLTLAQHAILYLDRYANHTKLKELVISVDTVADTDNVLDAVLHLGQLERLKILFSRAWKSTQVQGFLDRLSEACPNLSSLAITCDNAPSTQSINTLKRLDHLEELGFSIKGLDHDDGFWQAIKTFSQLKCIHVHPGKSINRHRRSSLQKQRPDLKIIVQTRHFEGW
ncbi:hypothetical protein O0I10_006275 [Lichtheimia ornata]|uniref:F-box domain-containing protein n=1 Tax=Lichtheimia ornata TaxID=688661 RepID=A0AAD7V388_9FUNG|nr:uncharacterized protein O0I10_006275 [Lichtheimia ornata]KAJ8658004.1 hypothetical protein O0I10_006275 [Lichtheimia ornata]